MLLYGYDEIKLALSLHKPLQELVNVYLVGGNMKKKVLAVDDSATVREFLRSTLETAGYQVILASDGNEALSVLSVSDGSIDMVLTDLNMPIMDGIQFIREVRSLPGYRFKPVMMLTSETQQELRIEGKAAGASCWLNKPFKPEKLLSVIRMVLPA